MIACCVVFFFFFCGCSLNEFNGLRSQLRLISVTPGQGAVLIHNRESCVQWGFLDLVIFYCPSVECGQAPRHLRTQRERDLFSLGSQYYVLSVCQSLTRNLLIKTFRSKIDSPGLRKSRFQVHPCLRNSQPKKNDLYSQFLSRSGALINSHYKAVLLGENNARPQQGKTEKTELFQHVKAPAGRTSPLSFTGWGLWGRCNPLKERKARSVYWSIQQEKCESLPRGENSGDLGCNKNVLFPFNREQKQGAVLTPVSEKKMMFVFSTPEKCPEIVHLSENITSGILPRSARPWLINPVNVHINSSCQTPTCPAKIL